MTGAKIKTIMKEKQTNDYKIKGTLSAPALKILPLEHTDISEKEGLLFIEGYANTKNTADRYGDIPTVFPLKRSYVYDLKEFRKNPVLLIDHVNRLDHLAGSVTDIFEDDKGLYFKALFSCSEHPTISHARQIYREGHAKGISIAGRFHYEDALNPDHLTLAEIFEISLVAVPADPSSLAGPSSDEKQTPQHANPAENIAKEISSWLEELKN